jgi:probable blue pigment (indigoidine) exporter
LILSSPVRFLLSGISFAILWASASVAGKFGLLSAEPLTLFTIRFLLAGVFLLVVALISRERKLPQGEEWWQLTVFGAFNTALYLGIFIISLKEVAAGITALAIALNPLMISLFSALWLKRAVKLREWLSILLGMSGVALATYPLLNTGYATVWGVSLLGLSMVMYSLGAVYYSSVKWKLTRTVINGWQVFIAGLLLLPFTLFFEGGGTTYDTRFWLSLFWLVVPVSVGAVQLWLYLLKEDAVRASLWLFLCPIFGLVFATILLDEPFTWHTLAGALVVMGSLYEGQRRTAK